MEKREKVAKDVEAEVLVRSRRRCCICYGLYREIGVKPGQIAHLDRDPTNSTMDNLVFLCLDHHNEYDSKTSQEKGFTKVEVICYRDELYKAMQDPKFWE